MRDDRLLVQQSVATPSTEASNGFKFYLPSECTKSTKTQIRLYTQKSIEGSCTAFIVKKTERDNMSDFIHVPYAKVCTHAGSLQNAIS